MQTTRTTRKNIGDIVKETIFALATDATNLDEFQHLLDSLNSSRNPDPSAPDEQPVEDACNRNGIYTSPTAGLVYKGKHGILFRSKEDDTDVTNGYVEDLVKTTRLDFRRIQCWSTIICGSKNLPPLVCAIYDDSNNSINPLVNCLKSYIEKSFVPLSALFIYHSGEDKISKREEGVKPYGDLGGIPHSKQFENIPCFDVYFDIRSPGPAKFPEGIKSEIIDAIQKL